MTTNQILQIARKRILELTTDVIDDATILLYANLTYKDIQKKIFPNDQILTTTVTFTAGVGTLPTNFGTLYGDAIQGTANYFPEVNIEDFSKQTLTQAVTIEGATLKVYPITTASVVIKYYPSFPEISTAVNPTINEYFHELIVDGIVYRTHFDLQDESLGTFYRQKYDTDLREKMATLSNYEEGNQKAGTMFNGLNLIGGLSDGNPNFF